MAEPLESGLYEQLITEQLKQQLQLSPTLESHSVPLDPADSHHAFVRHLTNLLEHSLRALPERDRVARQRAISNAVLELLRTETDALSPHEDDVVDPPELLLAVAERTAAVLDDYLRERPTIPLTATALLTNARGEPTIGAEIARELESADTVDLLCAFIRWYGVRVIRDPLERFFRRGGRMRVLTTTYMAASERIAIDALAALGAEVKIAYETQSTRLHAKAWLFRRRTGFTTGFVGSSNLSKSALVDGVEWNVRVSAMDTPTLIEKFNATFSTYWESDLFEDYDPARDGDRLSAALASEGPRTDISFALIDVHPLPHQRRILEELKTERDRHGRMRNLVVAATGTGKTVIAALDYKRLRAEWGGDPKLLFVAHRSEILDQSLATFRAVMRDGSFGERYVQGHKPEQWRHVFASIQSLTALGPENIAPDHFDMVIVDEFHHAAAATYRALLDHLQPRVLLGLTATPERTDGEDITARFDGRYASELRLWEALEEDLLVPFQYFGVHDDVSLEALEWKRGGYGVADLEGLYTGNDARVGKILQALHDQLPDPHSIRGLGFCVSIAHAEYMARKFTEAGIPSEAISANSPQEVRDNVLRRLGARQTNMVFAVDLFNEGVDVPQIDTVLFLRPTESATVFLQQLGRGLRKAEGKACLTVLDFIGQQHRNFRFDQRYRALTGSSRRELIGQINSGFPFLPAGCHISLDRVAQDLILDNIKESLGTRTRDLVRELRGLTDPPLNVFLDETGLELEDIYRSGRTWTQLRRAANLAVPEPGPDEERLGRALGRMLHIDDPERIAYWRSVLVSDNAPAVAALSDRERRLLVMLHFDLWGSSEHTSLEDSMRRLWPHTAVRSELAEVLSILEARARRLGQPLSDPVGAPLHLHCRYTLDEIMAAIGAASAEAPKPFREGAYYDRPTELDVFFVTLQKSEKDYSPTTLYRDFAISPQLFHWESQAKTSLSSPTGQRYLSGTRPLIFAREKKVSDSGSSMAYLCMGHASYVSHEGERPIAITWRLDHDLPGDFFEAARVAAS